jgi:hypothetical protein
MKCPLVGVSCYSKDCVFWPVCSRLEDIVGRFLGEVTIGHTKLSAKQAQEFFDFLNSKRKEE